MGVSPIGACGLYNCIDLFAKRRGLTGPYTLNAAHKKPYTYTSTFHYVHAYTLNVSIQHPFSLRIARIRRGEPRHGGTQPRRFSLRWQPKPTTAATDACTAGSNSRAGVGGGGVHRHVAYDV